jgi:hypothetical protein
MTIENKRHLDLIKALYPYGFVSYSQLNRLWLNLTPKKIKIDSFLIKKLISEKIIKKKIEKGKIRDAIYKIKQDKIKEILEGTKYDVMNDIPTEFIRDALPTKRLSFERNFHDEALKNIISSFYTLDYGFLIYPRIKVSNRPLIVPDAILGKKDKFSYIEYDNLSEEHSKLLAKLPRYLYDAKQHPDKKINLIFVFTDETTKVRGFKNKRVRPPYLRMKNVIESIGKLSALNGLPLKSEIEKQENFNVFLLTYAEAVKYLGPLLRSKKIPDFNQREFPLQYIDNNQELKNNTSPTKYIFE